MRTLCLIWLLSCSIWAASQPAQTTSSSAAQEITGITASVRDADGERLPEAEVLLNPAGLFDEASTLRGTGFSLPPGQYVLTAKFNSHLRSRVTVSLSHGEVRRVLFLLVTDGSSSCERSSVKELPAFFGDSQGQPSDSTVSVTVYDESGAVLPSAKVELLRTGPDSSGAAPMRLVLDALGSASLNTRPGSYSLKVSAPGFHELTFNFTIGGGEVFGIAQVLTVRGTCDGVVIDMPTGSTTPPSPNDHIEPIGSVDDTHHEAEIVGRITDYTGAGIGMAKIEIQSLETRKTTTFRPDSQGTFSIGVKQGRYRMAVKALGFRRWTKEITVPKGGKATVNVTLSVGAKALQ